MKTPLIAKLTIEGPLSEIARIAAHLSELEALDLAVAPIEVTPAREQLPGGTDGAWTPKEFHRFWTSLSQKSRLVLAGIARKPSGYPVDQLVRDLGPDLGGSGHVLSGALSSVGHRVKQFPGKEPIYIRDYSRGVFTMSAAISALIEKENAQ